VTEHKFKIGQTVHFRRKSLAAPPGPYQITRLLPAADGEFHYAMKSVDENHERVAAESELQAHPSAFDKWPN
jgi:hypothetical protein